MLTEVVGLRPVDEAPKLGNPYELYNPIGIYPCGVSPTGNNPWHLLACGHLVAVKADDRRCAMNCQHIVQNNGIPHHHFFQQHLRPDRHFCPLCIDIAFTNYRAIFANHPDIDMIRPTAAMTRAHLKATTALTLTDNQLTIGHDDSVLSSTFSVTIDSAFFWKNPHRLMCGHEVWVHQVRPCASNCMSQDLKCRGDFYPGNIKQPDVIICADCVLKAERLDTCDLETPQYYAAVPQNGMGTDAIASGVGHF